MDELYLLPAERQQVQSLDASLLEGWKLLDEQYVFNDTVELQTLRFSLLRLSDPVLKDFRRRLETAKDETEFHATLQTLDLSKMGDHDFQKLLFALGPDPVTLMIADVLANTAGKDDLELVAALAGLRHLMLESLIEADF